MSPCDGCEDCDLVKCEAASFGRDAKKNPEDDSDQFRLMVLLKFPLGGEELMR